MSIPVKKLKNGFSLPVLGLGTWLMGGDKTHNPDNDDTRDISAIRYAIDHGMTHIDTAENYADGYCETLVGKAIADYPRDRLSIASKVMFKNMAYKDVLNALENSLKRLNLNSLDLYYIHKPNHDIPFEETTKALNEAYQAGLINHIGIANALPETFDKVQALLDAPIVVNQVHYSLMFREPETALLKHALENDYFVMAWRPVRFNNNVTNRPNIKNAWEKGAYPLLDEMADKYQKTNVQIALNWLINQPNVLAIVKSADQNRLQEAIGATDWQLNEEDQQRLAQKFPGQQKFSDIIPLV